MSRGSSNQPNPDELKLLPDPQHAVAGAPVAAASSAVVVAQTPSRQLAEFPKEDLDLAALDLGLNPRKYKTRQHLVSAIHARRQAIASMNREAMVDVLRWAQRPPPTGASKEAIAHEIAHLRTMRFAGLSQRGLVVLAVMRGLDVRGDETVPVLIKRLKRQEGFFAKINRKRRAMLGAVVSNMMGEEDDPALESPAASGSDDATSRVAGAAPSARSASIKHEIEEAGLFGGLAGRIKKSADSYVNQKLDEVEARIDRKLDEIDRRLAEWRDKEIANRIRILKITLWASVIVGAFSLIYSYVKVYLVR